MSLDKFFKPESIAVVGASCHKGKVGYEILTNLIRAGYKGKIFPINPGSDTIEGLTCYDDIQSIGKTPDLVIVVIPAKKVPALMKQCAKINVKAVIIVTAGFKEVGPEGRELAKQFTQIAKQAGIRILGPNCLGVIVPANKINASFGGDLPAEGSVGYISQSGALLSAILDMAKAKDIGFSKLVSIGNKADVNELDILKVLGSDPDTKVIAGYLESIDQGDTFVKEAERISHKKPILMVKSGVTSAGAKAVSSHTGSLAGTDAAYEALFERVGIIRCDSIKSQIGYVQAFDGQPLPKGSAIAVITNAGGAGIMAVDTIEQQCLNIAKLSEETIDKISANLPPAASWHNPIDVLCDAPPERFEFALDIVLDDPNVDVVLVLLTPQAMTEPIATAKAIVKITSKKNKKPVLAGFLGVGKIEEAIRILREGKIPNYDSPQAAIMTIKAMTAYVKWCSRPKRVVKLFTVNRRKVEKIIKQHLSLGTLQIGEAESRKILQAYGFTTPKSFSATTAGKAIEIAKQLGYPVVLKIWSPDIIHKSDVGGVAMALNSPKEVMDAFDLMMYRIPREMPTAEVLGVVVQEMCSGGREVILGMNRDKHCGPLMMFGMGGIMVEVLKDVSFYLAPLTAGEAKQMLLNTKTYQMLTGVRGEDGVDMDAIAEGLQRLSQLVTEFPQIQEMDINPYVVGPEGTTPIAVDAKITLGKI